MNSNMSETNSTPLPATLIRSGTGENEGKKMGKILMVVSTLLFAGSLSLLAFNYNDFNATKTSAAPVETFQVTDNYKVRQTTKEQWTKLLQNIPENPKQVEAVATSGGKKIILESGKTYNYSNITFTWLGDKPVEPGTKIVGYYVYFGTKNTEIPFPNDGYQTSVNPRRDGEFVETNTFTVNPTDKGQTYYLYVVSVSDSKNSNEYYKYGMENLGLFKTLPARKLFTYIFQ